MGLGDETRSFPGPVSFLPKAFLRVLPPPHKEVPGRVLAGSPAPVSGRLAASFWLLAAPSGPACLLTRQGPEHLACKWCGPGPSVQDTALGRACPVWVCAPSRADCPSPHGSLCAPASVAGWSDSGVEGSQ